MGKLTLSVHPVVAKQAKRFAAARGTSVSRLVEQYLRLISRPSAHEEALPLSLARLRAEWRGTSVDHREYRRYLERKYR